MIPLYEETLADLAKSAQVAFTKKNPLPSSYKVITDNNLSFDPRHGILGIEVDSSAKHGGSEKAPRSNDFYGNFRENDRKSYHCMIYWHDWDQVLADYKDLFTTAKERGDYSNVDDLVEDLILNYDVALSCECPSFHWWGIKKVLKDSSSSDYPLVMDQNSYPQVPLTNPASKIAALTTPPNKVKYPLCKHLYAVVHDIVKNDRVPVIRHMIVKSLQSYFKKK